MDEEPVRLVAPTMKKLTMSFPMAYGLEEFEFVLEMMAAGKIAAAPLVSQVTPLEEAPQLFASLLKPNGHCKVLIAAEAGPA